MKVAVRTAAAITSVLLLCLLTAGCGYTTRSLLAPELKTICIENFTNKMPLLQETSNERSYRSYYPGLEVMLTKTVVDRFVMDGNLKIANADQADLILTGELVDFKRDTLQYDRQDNVQEYRVRVYVNLTLTNIRTHTVMWKEQNFSGESTYRTGGTLVKTEAQATEDTMEDLARRIVEKTIEGW